MGNGAERLYAKIFREMGYGFCKTTREGSRLYDSCAIDLMFLPVLVQIKAGRQHGMNVSKVLSDITERLKVNFPPDAPEHRMPKILIHHKPASQGSKGRIPTDVIVSMTFDDFQAIFNKAHEGNKNSSGEN